MNKSKCPYCTIPCGTSWCPWTKPKQRREVVVPFIVIFGALLLFTVNEDHPKTERQVERDLTNIRGDK